MSWYLTKYDARTARTQRTFWKRCFSPVITVGCQKIDPKLIVHLSIWLMVICSCADWSGAKCRKFNMVDGSKSFFIYLIMYDLSRYGNPKSLKSSWSEMTPEMQKNDNNQKISFPLSEWTLFFKASKLHQSENCVWVQPSDASVLLLSGNRYLRRKSVNRWLWISMVVGSVLTKVIVVSFQLFH